MIDAAVYGFVMWAFWCILLPSTFAVHIFDRCFNACTYNRYQTFRNVPFVS